MKPKYTNHGAILFPIVIISLGIITYNLLQKTTYDGLPLVQYVDGQPTIVQYVDGQPVTPNVTLSQGKMTGSEMFASSDGEVRTYTFLPKNGEKIVCMFEAGDPTKPSFCYRYEVSFSTEGFKPGE